MTAPEDDWYQHAHCRGINADFFYPARGDTAGILAAINYCQDCPVRIECLTVALDTNEWEGIWGGTSARQRRQMKRRNRQPVSTIECGTMAGYRRHIRDSSETCERCRAARAEHSRLQRMERSCKPERGL